MALLLLGLGLVIVLAARSKMGGGAASATTTGSTSPPVTPALPAKDFTDLRGGAWKYFQATPSQWHADLITSSKALPPYKTTRVSAPSEVQIIIAMETAAADAGGVTPSPDTTILANTTHTDSKGHKWKVTVVPGTAGTTDVWTATSIDVPPPYARAVVVSPDAVSLKIAIEEAAKGGGGTVMMDTLPPKPTALAMPTDIPALPPILIGSGLAGDLSVPKHVITPLTGVKAGAVAYSLDNEGPKAPLGVQIVTYVATGSPERVAFGIRPVTAPGTAEVAWGFYPISYLVETALALPAMPAIAGGSVAVQPTPPATTPYTKIAAVELAPIGSPSSSGRGIEVLMDGVTNEITFADFMIVDPDNDGKLPFTTTRRKEASWSLRKLADWLL